MVNELIDTKINCGNEQKKCNFRIVYMGTPDFAAKILQKMIEAGVNIVGVVTAPDKPAGRGQKLKQSEVKEIALQHGIKVLQPEKLKDMLFIDELKRLSPDLQVVVAFRMLPEIVWNLPPKGTFNLHASLLPQYRGAAPINHVIINGEKETGLTTFFLNNEIDTGNIIFSEKIEISPEETAGTLHNKLIPLGAELILKTINAIEDCTVKPIPQPQFTESELKKAPKIFKEDCRIDWNMQANEIINKIRGLSPFPTAFYEFSDSKGNIKRIKIFLALKSDTYDLNPGEILSDGKKFLKVGTKSNDIELIEIQSEGKKRMRVDEFLRGNIFTQESSS